MSLAGLRQRKHLKLLAAIAAFSLPMSTGGQSVWNGSVNNLWSASGNWANNNVPGDSMNEDAILNSGTAMVDANFSVRDFSFGGGTLLGSTGNDLDVEGMLTWSGGQMGMDSVVNATGSLDLSGTLTNSGVLNANITTGTIDVDLSMVFNNTGTLSVFGSTLNLRSGSNSGRLHAGTGGTILVQGVGSYVLAAGSSLSGDGLFSIVSAVNLQESVSVTNLSVSGSLIGGTISTGGQFVWSGGEMKGGGLTTVSTGSLQVISGSTRSLEARQLVNNSTLEWSGSGDWFVHTGASIVNNSRFMLTGDATMSAAPLTVSGLLQNSGTLSKSVGAGTSSILIPLNNTGTVSVLSGTLKLVGGSGGGTLLVGPGARLIFAAGSAVPRTLANDVAITNSGTLVNAGFLSAPAAALTGNNLIMDPLTAAELNIIGDLAVEELIWNRGVLSGMGTSTTDAITFNNQWGVAGGRTLENGGSLIWGTGASWGLGLVDVISAFDNVNSGTIQNNAGARIIFDADGVMGLEQLRQNLKVENSGEIDISAGKTVTIHGRVSNVGTVSLANGATLNLTLGGLSSGTFLVGENSVLKLTGPASHSFSTSAQLSGLGSDAPLHTVLFDSATTNFAGQVSGSINLQAGADENSGGVLNLQSGAIVQPKTMRLMGGSVNVQSGATLNTPALHLDSGRMTVEGGSINVGSTTVGTDSSSSILKINSGATFQSNDFEVKAPGLLWLDGGALNVTNDVQLGGSAVGSGTIVGSVSSAGGVVTPGVEPGDVGEINISGGLTLDVASSIGIDVNADTLTSDTVDIGGALQLGGAFLFVTVEGDPTNLSSANSFVILSSAARSGTFTFLESLPGRVKAFDTSNNEVGDFQVTYTAGEVILNSWVPEPSVQVAVVASALLLRRRRVAVAA